MKISVVIPTLRFENYLDKCVKSIKDQCDEIIVIDEKIDNLATKINKGLAKAKHEFIIVLNDDVILTTGNLKDLCVSDCVTSPLIRGGIPMGKAFHGHAWCIPQKVYKDVGPMYEGYDGFYFDDADYQMMISKKGYEIKVIESVDFYHPPLGGTTLHQFPDWQEKYGKNEAIYKERWS